MIRPRCADHTNEKWFPNKCAVCRRIWIEQRIVRRLVESLIERGWALDIDNGGNENVFGGPQTDARKIKNAMMQTDEEALLVYWNPGDRPRISAVQLVYGNDGWDVIADYTSLLEPELASVLSLAASLEGTTWS